MNDNVVAYSRADTAIHVILDNLSTHKPKIYGWRARHKNVHFHFTPTRASWLNEVEIWFSILAGISCCAAPPSPRSANCCEHIDAFIDSYNARHYALRLD